MAGFAGSGGGGGSCAAGDLGEDSCSRKLGESWSLGLRAPVAPRTRTPSCACPWGISRTARCLGGECTEFEPSFESRVLTPELEKLIGTQPRFLTSVGWFGLGSDAAA